MSRTISITIPDQLENDLKNKSEQIGISRSRFICYVLLDWQRNKQSPNKCLNLNNGWCSAYKFCCSAPQHEAETCPEYSEQKES